MNDDSDLKDVCVFVARARPFHLGHKSVVDEALRQSKHVIIFIGSANSPLTTYNPFTVKEVKEMIYGSYTIDEQSRITIEGVEDKGHIIKWAAQIRNKVSAIISDKNLGDGVYLIGHEKDNTSFYLKCFPEWGSISVPLYENINATDIRSSILNQCNLDEMSPYLPKGTLSFLEGWMKGKECTNIIQENEFMKKYLSKFESDGNKQYNIKPKFYTADNVVIHSGHVLLIQRKEYPCKGMWALVGGHVDDNETAQQASIRELYEETKINVSKSILNKSLLHSKTFDNPHRSTRGRTITQAFLYSLPQIVRGTNATKIKKDISLPKIQASDDARKAKWFPINQVLDSMRPMMMEDHYVIIEQMIDWLSANNKEGI